MYLFIHRKDLRGKDLRAFDALLKRELPGIHLVIMDPALLAGPRLDSHSGRNFMQAVHHLREEYDSAKQTLHLLYGEPSLIVDALLEMHSIAGIVAHADYTPYARKRDASIEIVANRHGVPWVQIADLPLVPLDDFQRFTQRSEPYKVFTPFYRKWRSYAADFYAPAGQATIGDLHTVPIINELIEARFSLPPPVAEALAAASQTLRQAREKSKPITDKGSKSAQAQQRLQKFIKNGLTAYDGQRDAFAIPEGTSGIAKDLNVGAISARTAYEAASGEPGAESWIRQLVWRDFYLYQAIHNPDFYSYEQRYDLTSLYDAHFEAWSLGQTGIPIIDAAMSQLNETGELPNRLRMVTAMFLTKNLLCPFTLGEVWFRSKLADYDNTLNRGGWLWSSSMGYDAVPYFRIMNPVTQSETHDPGGTYIRRWQPQLAHLSDRDIHKPQKNAIVDLKASRARAIDLYKIILGG
ncbi:deoxyribodipyrimidine photo-lyase [Paenibacillaceae bacterium]|nr:deoxyribodipyrimidine photo-lyase [Paenibacillaceae bacterium]